MKRANAVRAALSDDEHRTPHSVTLRPRVVALADEMARRDNRSRSAWIETLILETANVRGLL